MRTSKHSLDLAEDLGLTKAEAAVMELKSRLYQQAAQSILKSKLTHEEIAKKIGTSRARITRISNRGENSISLELLIKLIVTLDNKLPVRVA